MSITEERILRESESVFIPPDGAMQFHYQRRKDGREPFGGQWPFWVLPLDFLVNDQREFKCRCSKFYEVIISSIPKHVMPFVVKSGLDRLYVVCDCLGEVIE